MVADQTDPFIVDIGVYYRKGFTCSVGIVK